MHDQITDDISTGVMNASMNAATAINNRDASATFRVSSRSSFSSLLPLRNSTPNFMPEADTIINAPISITPCAATKAVAVVTGNIP